VHAALPFCRQPLVQHAAAIVLVLLTACSECHLLSRTPGCRAEALEVARGAIDWSRESGLSPALAHRQLGRLYRETGAEGPAEVELRQVSDEAHGLVLQSRAVLRLNVVVLFCNVTHR